MGQLVLSGGNAHCGSHSHPWLLDDQVRETQRSMHSLVLDELLDDKNGSQDCQNRVSYYGSPKTCATLISSGIVSVPAKTQLEFGARSIEY